MKHLLNKHSLEEIRMWSSKYWVQCKKLGFNTFKSDDEKSIFWYLKHFCTVSEPDSRWVLLFLFATLEMKNFLLQLY